MVDQNLRIQELEAKTILLEKYIEKTVKLEREEIPEMRDRIEDLELQCDENEQYHRQLCLRFKVHMKQNFLFSVLIELFVLISMVQSVFSSAL